MRGASWVRCATSAALLLISCGEMLSDVNVVPVGPPRAARAAGCAIEFVDTAPEELRSDWVRVGEVCAIKPEASRGPLSYPNIREAIRNAACGLGGEVASVSGSCAFPVYARTAPGVQFTVLARRPASTATGSGSGAPQVPP